MGCAVSKKDEEDDVVSLCKERKRWMELAVARRYAFADAHCRYNHSLYAVAAAVRLFVARHSFPYSPFFITFPSCTSPEPPHENIACPTSGSAALQDSPELERENQEEEDEEEPVCEYFYGDMTPPMGTVQKSFKWDFFDLFDGVTTEEAREEDEEGETKERKVVDMAEGKDMDVNQEDGKGLQMIGEPPEGKELLQALKDVEDHFIRVYVPGLDVCRMLEANRVSMHSESSNKFLWSIPCNQSTPSRSSPCKSLLLCSSRCSWTWTELKNDLWGGCGGMESGSHSLMLGRLCAWEKKLYEEVKAGDATWKIYKKKCSRLRNWDVMGDDVYSLEKTRAKVHDLKARLLVAIRRAESISQRIQKLIDDELQPQLIELIHRLLRNWKLTLESHETQKRIMSEVKSFNCPTYGKFCNDSHRHATFQLEAVVRNWRNCFTAYISSQKLYVEALSNWLSKFICPGVEFNPRVCRDWFACLEKLPEQSVTSSMKSLGRDIRALLFKQGQEQQQKRRVDELVKELDRKILALERAESRILESRLYDPESEIEYLTERKASLDVFRKKVDMEKAKHQSSMRDTQCTAVNVFRTGFSTVFESLAVFSRASEEMYADLLTFSKNSKEGDECK